METKARKQYLVSTTGKKKRVIRTLVVLAFFCAGIGLLFFVNSLKYRPPVHESNAIMGAPMPNESYLYSELTSQFNYTFGLAANLYRQADGSINLYLYNLPTNEGEMMVEICDRENEDMVYYRSGLLNPGEYVERLTPNIHFTNEMHEITIKVYSFEPETYRSNGTTLLDAVLQPW